MSNGGSLNFQYSFGDKNCDSICKSNQVQTGCKFGFKCKVNSKCQNDNCLCNLEMSCNRKTSGGNSATLDGNSGNSDATFEGRNSGNSAVTFEGGSENSPAISAKYLGLVKTSNIIYILILKIEQMIVISCLFTCFRLFNLKIKNSSYFKWRVTEISISFW